MLDQRTFIEVVNAWSGSAIAWLIGALSTLIAFQAAGLLGLVLVLIAPLIGVYLHELGHAFAAKQFGMEVTEFKVGPFVNLKGRWTVDFSDDSFGSDVGGHVAYVETDRRSLDAASESMITFAGPAANLVVTLITFTVGYALLPPGPLSGLIIAFGFQSLAMFVGSLWPMRLNSGAISDGAKLVSIAKSRRALRLFQIKRRQGSGWNDR